MKRPIEWRFVWTGIAFAAFGGSALLAGENISLQENFALALRFFAGYMAAMAVRGFIDAGRANREHQKRRQERA